MGNDFKPAPLSEALVDHVHQAIPVLSEASAPHCCGTGGGLCSSSPELADRFLDQIIAEGKGRTMVTYCIGCQNRFLKRGVEAVHLLECLPGVTPRRKVSSPLGQWLNRLALAMIEKMKTGLLMKKFMRKIKDE
jgi:hypothetical protein